jgi:hypothetical protein
MDRDCQSGACANGRCSEAKFCATRYLYDNLGVTIQLRTYDGVAATLGHQQEPIKCGQCVCQECPVRIQRPKQAALKTLPRPPAPGALLARSRPDILIPPNTPDHPVR